MTEPVKRTFKVMTRKERQEDDMKKAKWEKEHPFDEPPWATEEDGVD